MKLSAARLCIDAYCEEIFDGQSCPRCGSDVYLPLARCLEPLGGRTDSDGNPVPGVGDVRSIGPLRFHAVSA